MGAENQHGAVRHFLDGFDKNRAAAAQLLHNVRVMNDLVVHIDGCAIGFQRQLDDINRAHYARAESPRPYPQQYLSIRRSQHCHPDESISVDSIIPHAAPHPHPVSLRFQSLKF